MSKKKIISNPLTELINPQGGDKNKVDTVRRGLEDNYSRATLIVREDYLDMLKNVAYTDRITIKDLMEKVMKEYIDNNVKDRKDLLQRKE